MRVSQTYYLTHRFRNCMILIIFICIECERAHEVEMKIAMISICRYIHTAFRHFKDGQYLSEMDENL